MAYRVGNAALLRHWGDGQEDEYSAVMCRADTGLYLSSVERVSGIGMAAKGSSLRSRE
jgi:hypothetical protein